MQKDWKKRQKHKKRHKKNNNKKIDKALLVDWGRTLQFSFSSKILQKLLNFPHIFIFRS